MDSTAKFSDIRFSISPGKIVQISCKISRWSSKDNFLHFEEHISEKLTVFSFSGSFLAVNTVMFVSRDNRDFKNQRRGRQRERQKNNRFCKQNNNFAHASRFFVHFFARFCTITTWKCLISRFMEDVNKRRRNFISISVLGYGQEIQFHGGFAYIWQSRWVGIIAIKTERTQIHFLSDVLIAIASLNLKVPNEPLLNRIWQRLRSLKNMFI